MSVENVSTIKLLDVMLSNELTWQVHFDYVLTKANLRFYVIRKLRRAGQNKSDLVNIVRTCSEYASPSWASLSAILSEDIKSLQRRTLRINHLS